MSVFSAVDHAYARALAFLKHKEVMIQQIHLHYGFVQVHWNEGNVLGTNQIETVFGRSDQVTLAKYDILLRQNKPGEAMKVLQDYNAEETSERVLAILGDHEMAEYRDSSALAYYSEALALDPDYPPAVLGKAEVYRSRRNYPAYFDTLTEFFGNENATAADKSHYLSALLQHADGHFIQKEPLFTKDGGHGMLFRTPEGGLRLALHSPNTHLAERPRFIPVTL